MIFYAIKDLNTQMYLDDFGAFSPYLKDATYFFTRKEAEAYVKFEELFDCEIVKCVVKEVN